MALSAADLDRFADMLRSQSWVWQNAKNEYDQVKEVNYNGLTRKRVVSGDSASLEAVLEHTYEYLSKRTGGGVRALVDDRFIVDYEVRGNMDRPARYEPDCLGLSFTVNWNVRKVETVLYTGVATGFTKPSIPLRDAGLCGVAFSGQNKITRLVKGCLMYLDHLGKGAVAYRMPSITTMEYNLENVHAALEYSDTAFVFSDQNSQHVSNWILYAMCEEYPHPTIGGMEHLSIPADADNILLVSYNPVSGPEDVVLTAELIWGTLIHYANNFKVGSDLEKALPIACTLRQNKYLKKIGLPRVVSYVDLIHPMVSFSSCGVTNKTCMGTVSATVLGRVHQMLMMILVKDVDVYAHCTSTMIEFVDRDLMSWFFNDSHTLLDYMEDKFVVGILQLTSPMIWLRYLDTEGLSIIRKTSVFEGFWLVEYPKEVLRGGVISCLKKGMKHSCYSIRIKRVGIDIDSYNILMNEIMLGGGSSDDFSLPDGAFNVGFAGLSCIPKKASRRVLSKKGKRPKIGYEDDNVTNTRKSGGLLPCDLESDFVREDASWGWELDSGEEKEGGDK